METAKVSEHYMRLGMTEQMRKSIDAWRISRLEIDGRIPSFSEAVRALIDVGLGNEN